MTLQYQRQLFAPDANVITRQWNRRQSITCATEGIMVLREYDMPLIISIRIVGKRIERLQLSNIKRHSGSQQLNLYT